MAVRRTDAQCLQDQEIERALEELDAIASSDRHSRRVSIDPTPRMSRWGSPTTSSGRYRTARWREATARQSSPDVSASGNGRPKPSEGWLLGQDSNLQPSG